MADNNQEQENNNNESEILNCMAQGKRHILVHDYCTAVQYLEEAVKLYDSKYGISADECADAYFRYGHALLELHRQESGALDGLVGAKSDAEDEEDDEEIEDEEEELKPEEDKKEENGNKEAINDEEDITTSPTPPVSENNGNTSIATSTIEQQENNSNGNASTTAVAGSISGSLNSSLATSQMETNDVDPNQPSTSTGITDENRAEDEEDDSTPSNIEVAFEVLSMAKNIFIRQTEYRDDVHLKLAETLQKIGEILIEWENNEEALKELLECLEIRKRHLPDDDRLIAEAYYHIGLTYSLSSKIDEANNYFQQAVDVIEQRLTKLKKMYTTIESESEKIKIETEIKDLESVLPDMKGRIEDSKDQMTSEKLAEETEKLEEEKIAEKKKQILSKPISNVQLLVKRKREPEEPDSTENGNKKLKNGNENGQSTNNVTNGTTTAVESTTNNVEMENNV